MKIYSYHDWEELKRYNLRKHSQWSDEIKIGHTLILPQYDYSLDDAIKKYQDSGYKDVRCILVKEMNGPVKFFKEYDIYGKPPRHYYSFIIQDNELQELIDNLSYYIGITTQSKTENYPGGYWIVEMDR